MSESLPPPATPRHPKPDQGAPLSAYVSRFGPDGGARLGRSAELDAGRVAQVMGQERDLRQSRPRVGPNLAREPRSNDVGEVPGRDDEGAEPLERTSLEDEPTVGRGTACGVRVEV